jgi:hypothetical protein
MTTPTTPRDESDFEKEAEMKKVQDQLLQGNTANKVN